MESQEDGSTKQNSLELLYIYYVIILGNYTNSYVIQHRV